MSIVYLGKATPASGGSSGGSGDAVWGSITGTLSDQTDLQTALNAKQDTLTAGSNITISGDTISATDTTYSAFGGATGSVAGSAGLVPAPTTSDVGKFLSADGTWATAGGSVSFDGTTINENASNELQAIGVIDKNSGSALAFWHGTEAEYNVGGAVKDTYYGWGKATFSDISTIENPPQQSYNLIDGDGKLVYLGASSKLYYSTDLGETWSDVTLSDNYATGSIAYGNNKFVIIYGKKYISSSNLTTWSSAAYFNYYMKFVVFGSNKFVVVGDVNVSEYYYSEDGSSWTTRNMPESATFRVFKFVNNKFIGLTSNKMFISEDGLSWTVRTLPENSSNWNGVAYGNGKYVISQNQGHAYYTDDLSTWTQCNTLINIGNNVLFVNDKFMSFDTVNSAGTLPNGDVVSVSEDGINWGNYNGGGYQFTSILLKDGVVYAVDVESGSKFVEYTGGTLYLTTEDHPTTSSVVYDSSGNQSALTVTSGGTIYIQLSDGSWYDSVGAIITSYTVGESYPNYICFIDGVGVKIGTTTIATATTVSQTYDATSTDAISGVGVAQALARP